MTSKEKIHQLHLSEWTTRFADQKASGLTVKQWCEQNGFTIHTYNYWKHILKEEVVNKALPDIVPLTLPDATPSLPVAQTPTSVLPFLSIYNQSDAIQSSICFSQNRTWSSSKLFGYTTSCALCPITASNSRCSARYSIFSQIAL